MIEVPDAYTLLKEYESRGQLIIRRYEEQSPRALQWYREAILEYLKRKKMHLTPECSYARFVREKFPEVWEVFDKE